MLDSATIAAISTPPGTGALGVIRISGPDAAAIANRVFRSSRGKPLALTAKQSHRVFYGQIVDPETDALIDDVLLTWLAGPHSYTTEDTVEISCHGGPLAVAGDVAGRARVRRASCRAGRIHLARLSQRAARSGAGRSGA